MDSESIFSEYQDIIAQWETKQKLPHIAGIFIPSESDFTKGHKNQFGYFWLEDNSVGFMYIQLNEKLPKRLSEFNTKTLIGQSPLTLLSHLGDSDELQHLMAFGVLSAVSQHILSAGRYEFNYTMDPFGSLNILPQDMVGMVGFFPPLVNFCEQHDIPLIVIEKKPELVQKKQNFEVCLDPSRLNQCNKVLITGTTILNNSIDEVLSQCKNAKKIAVVGPSASILPDPLFRRGVTVIGGTQVRDIGLFHTLFQSNNSWNPAVQKYCISREDYPGWNNFLRKINYL